MLDRAGGGGGGGDFGSDESSGGDFGSSGPGAPRKPAMASAGGKSGDLDDEIPF
jgi:single-strand DNA-binding protein